jgi:flagellar hook-basal body complex protein FliE
MREADGADGGSGGHMVGTVYNNSQVSGDSFVLKSTSPRHIGGGDSGKSGAKDFGALLMDSMNEVNQKQVDYANLTQKAILDPGSVDPHDITIAGAEANLSLNIAKNVLDRVIRAYRDITSLR